MLIGETFEVIVGVDVKPQDRVLCPPLVTILICIPCSACQSQKKARYDIQAVLKITWLTFVDGCVGGVLLPDASTLATFHA